MLHFVKLGLRPDSGTGHLAIFWRSKFWQPNRWEDKEGQMEQGTAPAAMAQDLDGGFSMPGEGQAIGHHQDDQTNLMVTDGYGMTSDDYQSDLDRVAAMPLPMDDESDFDNFQGDSDVEIIAREDGQENLESHKIDPDVLTAGQQVSGTLEHRPHSRQVSVSDLTVL